MAKLSRGVFPAAPSGDPDAGIWNGVGERDCDELDGEVDDEVDELGCEDDRGQNAAYVSQGIDTRFILREHLISTEFG